MVKFNQDYFWLFQAFFIFLVMLSPTPTPGLLTQHGNFQNFLKWPKNLSCEWHKTARFLGDSLLVFFISQNRKRACVGLRLRLRLRASLPVCAR